MQFTRSISPMGLLFAAMGGIIGSGWLFGPFYAAQIAGPAAILSWVIGGGLMMLIALTFAELATMFPIAGGMVKFSEISHGPLVGFTMAWISWLAAVVVAPIETMALLQYVSNYLPGVMNPDGAHVFTHFGIFLSAVVMLSMCVLNAVGAKWLAKTNSTIVIWKCLIPLTTVVLFVHAQFSVNNFYQYGGFAPSGLKGILTALPAAGVIFSFIGYSPAIQLAGEAKNPQKAIPLAIIGSLSACILLYFLVQVTFIGSLNGSDLALGWSKLNFVGDNGPFAGLAVALGLGWFVKVLFFDAAVSPYGTAFIYTAATARINYAMSQNGYFPSFFQTLSSKGIPLNAIIVNFIVGMLFFLPFPGWQSLVSFLISAFVIAYAVGPVALMRLRKTHPELTRPFKLPYAKWMALAAFYVCNLIVFWTGWHTVSRILLTIGIGYAYFVYHCWKHRGNRAMELREGIWLFPHFIGIGMISYLGSFGGGHNVLAFGPDFFVIALFSVAVFFTAVSPRDKNAGSCRSKIEAKLEANDLS